MADADKLSRSIETSARSVLSVAPAVLDVAGAEQCLRQAAEADKRGYFAPNEDESLRITFGRYLLARAALYEAIADLKPIAFEVSAPSPFREQAFLVGYAAATLLVNSATFIVEHVRMRPLLRQKLDEAEPRFGIPRKQFTRIYRSLTSPGNLLALHRAQMFIQQRADELKACATGPSLKEISSLIESHPLRYSGLTKGIRSRLHYRLYSFVRRNLSGYQQALFSVMEGSGRVVSELKNPLRDKSVTDSVRAELHKHLQPGEA